MSERKNIDRLFQEKFKDFEVTPSDKVWENIQSKMNRKDTKTTLLPFWLRLCSFAAVFLIGFAVATTFIAGPFGLKNPFVKTDQTNVSTDTKANTSDETDGQNKVVVNESSEDKGTASDKATTSIVVKDSKKDSPAKNFPAESSRTASSRATATKNTSGNANANTTSRNANTTSRNANTTSRNAIHSSVAESSATAGKSAAGNFGSKTSDSKVASNGSNNNKTIGNNSNAASTVAVADNDKEAQRISNKPVSENASVTPKTENVVAENNKISTYNEADHHFIDPNKTKVAHEAGNRYVSATTEDPANESSMDRKKTDALAKDKNTNDSVKESSVASNAAMDKNLEKGVTAVVDSLASASKEVAEKSEEDKSEEDKKEKDKNEKGSKWIVSSTFSPVYMNLNGSGSALDSKFSENSKSYQTSMSYGVGVKYALNKKWTIRTGLNLLNFEYNTNNLTYYYSTNGAGLEHVDENGAGVGIVIENPDPKGIAYNDQGIVTKRFTGMVNHRMNYIEMPLEASYKLLNKRFGIDVIGGVSSMFLNDNRVSLVSSDSNTNIGEANNLNKIHFSTNVGLGLRYNFMKTLQANVEPMFKYQINTYNGDAGNFKPYFFGVYTGLSFSF